MTQDSSNAREWALLLEEFERRQQQARAMGGENRLERRREAGLCNARELIALLCDQDSFCELGTLVGGHSYQGETTQPADALVGGLARIDGRPVVLACEDFTVSGGSIGHGTAAKRLRLARLARQERCPFILILDGAGARASNAFERYPYAPNDLQELVSLSGEVPTVALVLGSSAGHGILSGVLMDFVIALENASLFAAGPPLVEAALGEKVSKEALGGALMHARESGVVHNLAANEQAAAAMIRRYLSFLPANAWEYPPLTIVGEDRGPRRLDAMLDIVPCNNRQAYDMRKVLTLLADQGDFFEFQPLYGNSLLTGFLRLGGEACAVVANQPLVLAGSITANAASKAAHFLQLANAWHLPVLFLTDNPGIMSGSKAEREGTLRAAARMYQAQARLSVPKLHVTLRKAFGFGSSLMAMNPFDQQTLSVAFPGISLGGLPAGSGSKAAKLDDERAAQLAAAVTSGAWITGDTMAFDEIIDPRELRNIFLHALRVSRQRRSLAAAPVTTSGIGC